jgi:hypothetical protein
MIFDQVFKSLISFLSVRDYSTVVGFSKFDFFLAKSYEEVEDFLASCSSVIKLAKTVLPATNLLSVSKTVEEYVAVVFDPVDQH